MPRRPCPRPNHRSMIRTPRSTVRTPRRTVRTPRRTVRTPCRTVRSILRASHSVHWGHSAHVPHSRRVRAWVRVRGGCRGLVLTAYECEQAQSEDSCQPGRCGHLCPSVGAESAGSHTRAAPIYADGCLSPCRQRHHPTAPHASDGTDGTAGGAAARRPDRRCLHGPPRGRHQPAPCVYGLPTGPDTRSCPLILF